MRILRAHLAYLRYLLRHKRFVWQECRKMGLPWHVGLLHDWTKFLPDEWFPYVRWFHLEGGAEAFAQAGRLPPDLPLPLERAVLLHKHRNRHHWEHHVIPGPEAPRALEMSETDRRECLADWRGAGRAQGRPDTLLWYLDHKDAIVLHPATRAWIEKELGVDGYSRFLWG